MSDIFYACSFSGKVNYDTGDIHPEYRELIERDLEMLRKRGHQVFCAVEAEGWKIGVATPGEGVTWDTEEIDKAEVLVARLEGSVSAGVQWEMGYAHGRGKLVYALASKSQELAYWNEGLVQAGFVKRLETIEELGQNEATS